MSIVSTRAVPCGPRRASAAATLLTAALAAVFAPPAFAADSAADTLSERAFLEDLPVLSASRLPQSAAEVPGAVTVFDREFIRATGYREIGQILRLVPGMGVVNDRGHSPWIAYHGLGSDFSNRMQVLVDGRSVYSPSLIGGADWSGLPVTLEEIDRIEVLRGSNSATYGSNAFLGVVNIITRHAAQDQGTALGVNAGQRGLLDGLARFGTQTGGLALRLVANHIEDQGYRKLDDDRRTDIFTLRADYRLNARDELTFQAGANDGKRMNGFATSPNNTNGLRDLVSYNRFAQARFRRTFDAGNEVSVGYYRNDESITEAFTVVALPFSSALPVDVNRQSTRDNIDFQHVFTPGPSFRMVWGAEARRDWVQSASAFYGYGDASNRLWRTFANGEWRPIERVVLNAGAMYERYNGESPRVAPRLFANWTPVTGHTLRAGYSVAYREPSLFEQRADQRFYAGPVLLSYPIFGSGNVKPERIDAYELGWVGQWSGWSTDLRVSDERIANLVYRPDTHTPAGFTPVVSGTQTYANANEDVFATGAELQVKARPWSGAEIFAAGAYVRIRGFREEAERSAPRLQSNITWIQRYGYGWSTTLSVFRVGQRQWAGSVVTPSYWYADARIAYTFRWRAHTTEIAVVGQNLGRDREEFRLGSTYVPTQPISPLVFASVRLEL